MAKFVYKMTDAEANLAFKKGFAGQGVGNIAILSEKNNVFKLGSPGMTVVVSLKNGVCSTKASLFGKVLLASVNTKIELIDGFVKQ